jgi:three-Cys-motif partner protein
VRRATPRKHEHLDPSEAGARVLGPLDALNDPHPAREPEPVAADDVDGEDDVVVVSLPSGPERANDGLPARKIKPHTHEKFDRHRLYCALFNRGMRNMWPNNRGYLELFCSCGIAIDRGAEFDGCPLIAAKSEPPFTRMALVEFNPVLANALEQRLRIRDVDADRAQVFAGDANSIDTLTTAMDYLPAPGLIFCFVDPEDINGSWAAIEYLASRYRTHGQRVDFLINLPIGSMKRNITRSRKAITELLGTDEWWPRVQAGEPLGLVIRETYQLQFKRLGYRVAEHMEVRSEASNTPVYDLVERLMRRLGRQPFTVDARYPPGCDPPRGRLWIRRQADADNIRSTLIPSGNFDWTDDSGDGIQEPLLDVSNTTVFAPVLVAGSGGGGDTNAPLTVSFTFSCTDLTCDFDGSASSDTDGSIASWAWDLGDGGSASGATVTHTYAAGGTYTVTLTVTDDDGATGSDSQSVSVSEGSTADISLSATGYKVRGLQKADLSWSGATSTNVDVYRNGALITTTANDGFYTDNINNRGSGSYTYMVCEAGTSTCSNEATVTFS